MKPIEQFLKTEEIEFLKTYGLGQANEFKKPASGLPDFHKAMYEQWSRYYNALIPHLQGVSARPLPVYSRGLVGQTSPRVTKGQNHVLDELQASLQAVEQGASESLVAHIQTLRELLYIEETTNTRITGEA